MGNYRIGSAYPLDSSDLCVTRFGVDPRSTYSPGAESKHTLDGTLAYVGYPRSTWQFASLTIAQWSALKTLASGYSGTVYVETRDDDDTWNSWLAILRLPDPASLNRWGGKYLDVSLELILIEEQT
ncbi:MAG: hypothetical protein JXB35_10470 [Anaerolineae bacterium]|nr:hypothetical protein [Anaerolineae bacterium]